MINKKFISFQPVLNKNKFQNKTRKILIENCKQTNLFSLKLNEAVNARTERI